MNILHYIEKNLPRSIRYNPESEGTLIGLPYPYIVPCASGCFQEMYYWDTYFTHKGLIIRGDLEQVRNDIDNMRYLIREYGFMPNGNRINYLYNSQPPFLSMMMRDYYEEVKDKFWLKEAYEELKSEHVFWMTRRISDIGLNHYDCLPHPKDFTTFVAKIFRERTGIGMNDEDAVVARTGLAFGESGWDMNPRMVERAYEFAPADLNSLMYAMEENLRYFAMELGMEEDAKYWHKFREERGRLCRKYLKNQDNIFMDYNFVDGQLTNIFSVACFFPLYCGLANGEEAKAAKDALSRIETKYGVVTCEKNSVPGTYQWDYPNGWAPLQLIVVGGLLRYGYVEEACRIARKFVGLLEKSYQETGHLWEKYNVVDGNAKVQNEYEMPAMLGWTFGVYIWMRDMLSKNN